MTVNKSTLILSTLLVVIGQLLITQWTVEAAGDRDVIDFISFAGTIVGLILAVLAIIYSYIATASQKDDAEAVRTQISNLNDAVARANSAGNQFSQELTRLETIREELSTVSDISRQHIKLTEDVQHKVVLLAEKQAESETRRRRTRKVAVVEPASATVAQAAAENPELRLIRRAVLDQLLLYFITVADLTTDMAKDENRSNEFREFKKAFLATGRAHEDEAFWADLQRGETLAYYFVFSDLGATTPDRFPELKRAILRRFDEHGAADSYMYNEEATASKMETAKEWLRNDLAAAGDATEQKPI